MKKFETLIIGAGVGGYTAAIRLAQSGKKVAIVEKEKAGGVCLNKGCIPTKALLHAASMYHRAKKQGITRSGIEFKGAVLHIDRLRKWKNSVSDRLSRGLMLLFKEYGIEYINGVAEVEGGIVRIDGETVEYDHLILATGSSPNIPSVFSNLSYWTSYECLEVPEIPENLLVVGGGVIGVELASIYAMFGSKVTIVEVLSDILAFLDRDLRKVKAKELKKLGVRIHTSASFEKYDNGVAIIRKGDGTLIEVQADRILVATGRKPNIELAGALGIDIKDGFVVVKDTYETSKEGIFAIGDLIKGPMLAHRAHRDGIGVAEYIAYGRKPIGNIVPAIVYGDISLVSIGKSEDELIKDGINYRAGVFPLSANGRALTMESSEGFCKILGDPDTGKIFGIHIAGYGVDEMAGEISLAVNSGLTIEYIANTIHAHPTLGEALMEAAENFYRKSIHIPNK